MDVNSESSLIVSIETGWRDGGKNGSIEKSSNTIPSLFFEYPNKVFFFHGYDDIKRDFSVAAQAPNTFPTVFLNEMSKKKTQSFFFSTFYISFLFAERLFFSFFMECVVLSRRDDE